MVEPSSHVPLSLAQEPNWLTRVKAKLGEPRYVSTGYRMSDDNYSDVTRWAWTWFPSADEDTLINHTVTIDRCAWHHHPPVWRVQVRSHDSTKPQLEWSCRREPSNDDVETLLMASRFLEVDYDGADH
jgi:hypothetical protein